MKIKKIVFLLLIIFMVTGCGSTEEKEAVKVGTLTQLNTTPEKAANISGGEINFYENFVSMQMALSAGQIDRIQTHKSVGEYLIGLNSEFKIDESQRTLELVDNFCCAVRENDVELKNLLNSAIDGMKSDGTMDKLVEEYIDNASESPQSVEMPKIEGARTIRVGITGDLPPLDLVLADGTPAGFNTAVLAEISRRIQENMELIQVESASRAFALTSGKVDVIFWVVVPEDDVRPKDFDTPAGISVTDSYYQDVIIELNLADLGSMF